MSRPLKTGLDYFPHNTDAINDIKIQSLRAMYGNEGYAFYFILLELIYKTSECGLNLGDDLTLKLVIKTLGISEKKFERILNTAIKLELFDVNAWSSQKILISEAIKKRYEYISQKRQIWRKNKENRETEEEFSIEKTLKGKPGSNPHKEKKRKIYIYDQFDQFWNLYDKKTGKDKSFHLWKRLKAEEIKLIFEHLPGYVQSTPDKQYRKNPATYLRQRAWEDEIIKKPQEEFSETLNIIN